MRLRRVGIMRSIYTEREKQRHIDKAIGDLGRRIPFAPNKTNTVAKSRPRRPRARDGMKP